MADDRRKPSEERMRTADGVELLYRAWLPPTPTDRALLLFHRAHEHSGRWQEVVDALELDDVAVFAWDARGHGRSGGARGGVDSVAALVKDADTFVRHVVKRHRIAMDHMVVLGQGIGGLVATAWIHDYAPPVRGLILATPTFRLKRYASLAIPALRVRQALFGPIYVRSPVTAPMLTHDPDEMRRYAADPLISRQLAGSLIVDVHATAQRLLRDAGAIQTPTLVLAAGADQIVDLAAQRRFVAALTPLHQMVIFPYFHHAIFHERERGLPIARVRDFIRQRFDEPRLASSFLDADTRGPSHDAYARLCRRGGGRLAPVRWTMKTVGRLSAGIRLGWRAGFDSGAMLDYVYENRPRGFTPIGRHVDRLYLRRLGWRAIRQRRAHVERLLRTTIQRLNTEGRAVHLLDIASGPGRYVLETLASVGALPVTARLWDDRPEQIEAGRALAARLGLSAVTFGPGDPFDRPTLAALRPRPSIAIASGVYELVPDNGRVLTSLRGLADCLEPAGYLIYTNQPYHPHLEFIARVLRTRERRPWVMRCRSQAEMDQLVAAAGFEKIDMDIDRWGMCTVSLARRAS